MPVGASDPAALGWFDLPPSIQAAVEYDLGTRVIRALRQAPEFPDGVAARLQLDDGRWAFAKALPAGSPRLGSYRAEALVSVRLPADAPVPRVLSIVDAEFFVLVLSDIAGTRPRLQPGSPDLSAVIGMLSQLTRTLTPCPLQRVPPALGELGPLLTGWRRLRDARVPMDDWSARNLDSLAALETSWHPWAGGDTLLHNDLHPGNLVLTAPSSVLVINWRRPARGASWLDLMSLVPHMLAVGHTPADVDRLLKKRPSLATVPSWAITGFAIALAGYSQRVSLMPPPSLPSAVRAYQGRLAEVTRAWVAHRTRWE